MRDWGELKTVLAATRICWMQGGGRTGDHLPYGAEKAAIAMSTICRGSKSSP
jgi:hypothetical protein